MTTSEAMRSHAKPRHRHGEVRRQHREEQQSGHQSDDLRQLHNSTSAKNDDSGKEKVRRDLLYVEIWTVHVTSITFTMTWMTWMTSYHGHHTMDNDIWWHHTSAISLVDLTSPPRCSNSWGPRWCGPSANDSKSRCSGSTPPGNETKRNKKKRNKEKEHRNDRKNPQDRTG